MKIAILGAMDQEVELLKNSLQDAQTIQHQHLTVYQGTLHGVEVLLVKCGIGKVASAVATTLLIEKYAPDYVVNTGSAGGFDTSLKVGDLVIATGVQHHDVDLTNFGYQPGQVAGGDPAIYPCDEKLIVAAEKAATQLDDVKSIRGLICTGDAFIGNDDKVAELRKTFPDMSAVEMEGAAIGQACYILGVPFVVLRSLSDIAGTTSTMSFQQYLEIAGKNSAQLVMGMLAELAK